MRAMRTEDDQVTTRRLSGDRKTQIRRNTEKPIQKYRLVIQIAFALLCVWIGVEFHYFVKFLESGGATGSSFRPPGVEGFLPISSLMSLYYFFVSGQVHWAHPAGLFILIAIAVMSFVFGKAFCSWLCPVGFLSEMLGDIGQKLFRRKIVLPRWLDYPLRSLKYLLLAFFVYSIFFAMTTAALRAFLDSPYNIVADIKMYYFFADISRFALIVLGALFVLSIIIRNFWCRFLCPYGALLGLISFFSPTKIRRDSVSCIDCGKCARACPSWIKVDKVKTVVSDECTSCLNCIDVCPIANTLELKTVVGHKKVPKLLVAAGIVIIFVLATGLGMLSGHWQNQITTQDYIKYEKNARSYGHPTGMSEISDLNKKAEQDLP